MACPLMIKFPACEYCKTSLGDIFFCKRCQKYSHYTCLVEVNDADRCTHKAQTLTQSQGWNVQ